MWRLQKQLKIKQVLKVPVKYFLLHFIFVVKIFASNYRVSFILLAGQGKNPLSPLHTKEIKKSV